MSATTKPVVDWKIDRLDDLTGKRYLITGGNSGVGYEAAAHLRRANADVFIASRSTAKGSAAATSLSAIEGAGAVEVIELDLASLESVRRANDAIRTHTDGLDGVINNAGIMQTPEQQTDDGFELQFGTNRAVWTSPAFLVPQACREFLDCRDNQSSGIAVTCR